jgi:hypothetical protein
MASACQGARHPAAIARGEDADVKRLSAADVLRTPISICQVSGTRRRRTAITAGQTPGVRWPSRRSSKWSCFPCELLRAHQGGRDCAQPQGGCARNGAGRRQRLGAPRILRFAITSRRASGPAGQSCAHRSRRRAGLAVAIIQGVLIDQTKNISSFFIRSHHQVAAGRESAPQRLFLVAG